MLTGLTRSPAWRDLPAAAWYFLIICISFLRSTSAKTKYKRRYSTALPQAGMLRTRVPRKSCHVDGRRTMDVIQHFSLVTRHSSLTKQALPKGQPALDHR